MEKYKYEITVSQMTKSGGSAPTSPKSRGRTLKTKRTSKIGKGDSQKASAIAKKVTPNVRTKGEKKFACRRGNGKKKQVN